MEILVTSGYQTCSADMDDTLYPMSSGINLACRKNIEGTTVNRYYDDGGGIIITKIIKLSFWNCRVHAAAFAHGRNWSTKVVLWVVQGIRDNNGGSKGKNKNTHGFVQSFFCQYLKDFPELILSCSWSIYS